MSWQSFHNSRGLPLYEAVYEHLRNEICRGTLQGRLPSKNQAAAALGVSKVTVEKAYEQLKAEGYIRAKARSGFFVDLNSPLAPAAEAPDSHNVHTPNQSSPTDQSDQSAPPAFFDLNTYAISADSFPFAVWRRLMRRVLADEGPAILGPTPTQGILALRQEIAAYLLKYRGISAGPEQIVVGAGSEWIWSLIIQLLGTRRHYAIENPGYEKVSHILNAYGVAMQRIGMTNDGIDQQALRRSRANVVHITPSHHFPLGMVMPIQQRLELLAMAAEKDMVIIEDDYDSEFRFAGRPIPALMGLDRSGRVIYVNTFAKSLAPSLRISYMVLPPTLLCLYERTLSFYACTVPGFEQHVMARFLGEGHFARHFNRMKALYKSKHDALVEAIESSRLAEHVLLRGKSVGLHLLLTLKNGLAEKDMVLQAANAGVYLRGLSAFCSEPCDIPPSTVVIGFAAINSQDATRLLNALEHAWL